MDIQRTEDANGRETPEGVKGGSAPFPYYCYKIDSEYVKVIQIFKEEKDIDDEELEPIIGISVNYHTDATCVDTEFLITSCYYGGKGIEEHIYSNRVEFFINGIFCNNPENVRRVLTRVNKLLMIERIYPALYDFIISDLSTCKIPSDELIYKKELFEDIEDPNWFNVTVCK